MAEKLVGPEKAALLVMALGENFAQVLQGLENFEVQKLGAYMTKTKDVSMDDLENVISEYHRKAFQSKEGLPVCDEGYVKRLILSALGEQRARPILDKLSSSHSEVDLSFVREIEPRSLVNFIKLEHPQTIALIVSNLSPSQAAEVLSLLPDALRVEVVMRMAGIKSVDTSMISEIAGVLEREIKLSGGSTGSQEIGGIQTVAEIMNNIDKSVSGEIFTYLEEKNKDLSDGIRELMFVFEDIAMIDDRGIQAILKNIENDKLIIALKTADENLKEKIFRNMSTRAAQMIEEEMEVMGPVRISEVEEAQKEIAAAARKLEESGEIVIARGEGDVVV